MDVKQLSQIQISAKKVDKSKKCSWEIKNM